VLECGFRRRVSGSIRLSRSWKKRRPVDLSRRKFLQYCQGASIAFFPAGIPFRPFSPFFLGESAATPSELQLHPEYRLKRGIEAVLRKVPAGFDDFVTEKYQDQIEAIFREWSLQLRQSPQDTAALSKVMSAGFLGSSLKAGQLRTTNEESPLKVWQVQYPLEPTLGSEAFLNEFRSSFDSFSTLLTAEFQIISIHTESLPSSALGEATPLVTVVRFDLVGTGTGFHREQRVGHWELRWEMLPSGAMRLQEWRVLDEARSRASAPVFLDITSHAFGGNRSYSSQLIPGTDYWRTILDGASGIDIYGHNGVSVADIDGDGLDDLYICQPAGLPNRLFRNHGDGTFEDITDSSGLGVLENTACALFADIDNDGRQDLIVVRTTGPLLFLNQGGGKFLLKPEAF